MRSINEIIRGLREDNDLTQIYVSRILKIAQQTYSNYETGAFEIPCRHIIALATFYNVTTDYLLGLSDFKAPAQILSKAASSQSSMGLLFTDIISLNTSDKKAVVDYVGLLMLREKSWGSSAV